MTHVRRSTLLGLALALAFGKLSLASLTFSTSPTATVLSQCVNATAKFGEVGSTGNWDGTLVLSNLAAVPTKAQLLTGVVFGLKDVNPTLSLTSAGLNTGSVLVTDASGTTSSAAIDLIGDTGAKKGRYQFKGNPGGAIGTGLFANAEYGVGTVGAGGIWGGNVVGNDDYAIAGPGTNFSLSTFAGQFPYVRNAIVLQFASLGGTIPLSKLQNVSFVYGSAPDAVLQGFTPSAAVPEPATWAAGLLGAVGLVRLRRRKA